MAELNNDENLEIEGKEDSKFLFENPQSNPNSASVGLQKASHICIILMWACFIIAFAGGVFYLGNIEDSHSYYEYSAVKAQANCAIGASCFAYGLVGAFFSFIFSRVLLGLSVMTKASETYLSKNKE